MQGATDKETIMAFVVLGLILMGMKYNEVGPVAAWSWWIVLAPFAVAVAWWSFSDASGRTARIQSDKVDARGRERREKAMEALGVNPKAIAAHSKAQKVRDAAKARAKA